MRASRPKKKPPPNLYLQSGSDIYMLRLSVNGKKHRESTHTNDVRKAMAFRDRRKAELLVGISHIDDRKFLIGSLVDDYLAATRRDGLETIAKSEERWRLHLAPSLQDPAG